MSGSELVSLIDRLRAEANRGVREHMGYGHYVTTPFHGTETRALLRDAAMALAARLDGGEWLHDGKEVAWVAKVERDWTTLEVRSGDIYAFNRETGRVYKLPDPAVPIVIFKRPAPTGEQP